MSVESLSLQDKIAALEEELRQVREHEKVLGNLLEKKLNEIYVHYHISRTIGSLHDLQDMLLQVIEIIRKSLPVARISVYLFNETRDSLDLAYYTGNDLVRKVPIPVGEGTPGRVAESGE